LLIFAKLERSSIFAQLKLKKTSTMKKVLAILAVAGFMAACNSGEDKAKMAADSARIADSTKSAMAADSASKAAADTMHAAMDTTKKM
jgi:hypothetical protein